MADKIDIAARLKASYEHKLTVPVDSDFPPAANVAASAGLPLPNSFAEIDLSQWGIMESSEGSVVRIQGRISARHNLIVEAFARKRRMTTRGALERVIEKFVESGEFARLMDQYD